MIHVSSRAVDKLREELIQKCLDSGIGFRIMVNADDLGKVTSSMKFDRQKPDDMVMDRGGVVLFSDPTSVAHVRDYHLDYLNNQDGGFFLIKRAVEARVPG